MCLEALFAYMPGNTMFRHTHFEGTLNPYAQTLRVLRYFQSLRVSGSLSGRVWKVFVGCIPRNITF